LPRLHPDLCVAEERGHLGGHEPDWDLVVSPVLRWLPKLRPGRSYGLHRGRHPPDDHGRRRAAHGPHRRRIVTPRRRGSIVANGVALLACFFFLFPVYWMVVTAFKPSGDIQLPTPKFFPAPFTLQHFVDGINKYHFWANARSSVIITFSVVGLSMALAFFAATALARFRFRGRKLFIVLLLVVQMVPFE